MAKVRNRYLPDGTPRPPGPTPRQQQIEAMRATRRRQVLTHVTEQEIADVTRSRIDDLDEVKARFEAMSEQAEKAARAYSDATQRATEAAKRAFRDAQAPPDRSPEGWYEFGTTTNAVPIGDFARQFLGVD